MRLLWVSGSWPLQVRVSPASLLVTQHWQQVPGGSSVETELHLYRSDIGKSSSSKPVYEAVCLAIHLHFLAETSCCRTTLQQVHPYVTAASPCRSGILACMPYFPGPALLQVLTPWHLVLSFTPPWASGWSMSLCGPPLDASACWPPCTRLPSGCRPGWGSSKGLCCPGGLWWLSR